MLVGVLVGELVVTVEGVGAAVDVVEDDGGSVTGLGADVAALVEGVAMAPPPPTLGPQADRASTPAARPTIPTCRPKRFLISFPPLCARANSR